LFSQMQRQRAGDTDSGQGLEDVASCGFHEGEFIRAEKSANWVRFVS
jgi:hypothetical protein